MLENYLLKGLVIGIVFGVPAGVVGVLSIQRALLYGAAAGLATGIGSSVADVFYACIGVFGVTLISDFLLAHQSVICMAGCILVIAMGICSFQKKETQVVLNEGNGHIAACFLSSFTIAIANPATVLSFMMVFSMFRIGGNQSMGENLRLVTGIFCGTCLWWIVIAVIVGRLRSRVNKHFYQKLNRIFGILMVLFGVVIGCHAFTA